MATRTYTTRGREFVIMLSGTPIQDYSSWTVEQVTEAGVELPIPGLDHIVSSSAQQTYAKTCDHIDRWLGSQQGDDDSACGRY